MIWIEAVLDQKLPMSSYEAVLKDGVVLCKLMNKIKPGSVRNFKTSIENIQAFRAAMKAFGVPASEVFQTNDLLEARNIQRVTSSLYALAKATKKNVDYKGPTLNQRPCGLHVCHVYYMLVLTKH